MKIDDFYWLLNGYEIITQTILHQERVNQMDRKYNYRRCGKRVQGRFSRNETTIFLNNLNCDLINQLK